MPCPFLWVQVSSRSQRDPSARVRVRGLYIQVQGLPGVANRLIRGQIHSLHWPTSFKRHCDRQVLICHSIHNFVPTILKTRTARIYFICTTSLPSPNLCSQYTIIPSRPSTVGKFNEHLNHMCHSMQGRTGIKWLKKYPSSVLHNLDLLLPQK